ncbi:hypothetical protein BZA77DRAFT_106809 [Pyronema omphalodes]|nr:hypothetical protein BZA77DRAFT_106809 [Pyronema omphalodes]
MSGFGKNPQQTPDYDSRSSQHYSGLQSPYGAYPTSHYSTTTSQAQVRRPLSAEQSVPHPPQALNEGVYGDRQYDLPTVLSYDPHQGSDRSMFTLVLYSPTDLTTPNRNYRLLFGTYRTNRLAPKAINPLNNFMLTVEVPSFQTSGSLQQARVELLVEGTDGEELGRVDIGVFTYTEPAATTFTSPSRPLKRKASADDVDLRSPVKRTATQPIRPKSDDYSAYAFPTSSPTTHTYSAASNEGSYRVYSGGYDHDSTHQTGTYHPPQASPRNFAYQYGTADMSHQGPSQTWPTGSDNSALLASPSHAEPANPTLIRTSTLQQADKSGDGNANRTPGFNPYSIYPHKAVLEIQGDLAQMARRWTEEEWSSKRRLVQFWRQQKGNTIHATFRAVPQSDRPTSAVCVSCIWWAERNECFVTSVDCIYLLESLIAVRFTVEEKNRIRRNLEGFRPLTVSKGKKECESFFKLIMQFPSPKPRNIEKDVKVFSWSILPHALKKIIGKYSASYSSTASIIPPTPGASPYPGAPPHESAHPHPRSSEAGLPPRQTASPVGEPLSLPPTTAGLPVTTVGSPSHISLPTIAVPGVWPQAHSLPATPQTLAPPQAHRGSWDVNVGVPVSPFLDNPGQATGYYSRDHIDDRTAPGHGHSSPQSSNVP